MARPRGKPRVRDTRSAETRSADFLTVGWLVATLTTLLCEVASMVAAWMMGPGEPSPRLSVLSGFMLFAALAIGLVTLILTPLVHLARSVRPPPGITAFAVVVGALPWLILIARSWK